MQYALDGKDQAMGIAKDYRGVDVIAFSNHVERINVGLVTKIDVSEAFASIDAVQNTVVYFTIVIILLIALVIYFIARSISKEIVGISEEIGAITKGNLEIQLKKSNIFEIQNLVDSLNRILASMKLAILRTGLSSSELGLGEAIKAKEEAEEKLKQVNDRLLLATKAGNVGIWDYDVVNNKLVWDEQMYALYGISHNKFGGAYDSWRNGLHPEDMKRGDKEIQMALKGEKKFDTEFRVVWPNGEIHHIRALAIVQRDKSGKPLRMIGTNWDITDLKNIENFKKKDKSKK
jgi:PAS domain-containing protein